MNVNVWNVYRFFCQSVYTNERISSSVFKVRKYVDRNK